MTRPLIVGEAPGPRTDPAVPLDGRTARRLAALAGVDEATLRRRATIRNILPAWPGPAGKGSAFDPTSREAVNAAHRLVAREARRGQLVVVLGRRAARALSVTLDGLHRLPYLEVDRRTVVQGPTVDVAGPLGPTWIFGGVMRLVPVRVVILPHPSGVNRWWNDPANVEAARELLAGAIA